MVGYLIIGITYAFASAVQPGPFQTYLVSQTLTNGWRRTWPAAFSPLISDGPIIVLVLLVLSRVPAWLEPVLRLGGGVFLLFLAGSAFRAWRNYQGIGLTVAASARRSVLRAALVNFLSPGPHLGWSLFLGPLLLKGWREAPGNGIAFVVGFYSAMVLTLAGIIALFAGTRNLGPRVGRSLLGVSAIALAAMACYQLWAGGRILLSS